MTANGDGSDVTSPAGGPHPAGAPAPRGASPSRLPTSRARLVLVTVLGTLIQVLNIVSSMVVLYLARRYWQDEGLAYYTQWRRFSASLAPILILGHAAALTRALGQSHDDATQRRDLAVSSYVLTGLVLLLTGLLMLMLPGLTGRWMMGSEQMAVIVPPLAVATIGKGLGQVAAAHLRGTFRYTLSHLLGLVLSGIGPVLLMPLVRSLSYTAGIWAVSWFQLAVGGALPAWWLVRVLGGRWRPSLAVLARHAAGLTGYGLARVPVLGLTMVLTSFGSWQLSNAGQLRELGLFNSILSLAMSCNIVAAAMTFTMLPLLAARMRGGNVEGARNTVQFLVQASWAAGLAIGSQLVFFGPSVAQVLLQRFDAEALSPLWGLPFLLVTGLLVTYVVQVAIDAYSAIPHYMAAYGAGIVVMFGLWFWGDHAGWGMLLTVGLCYAIGYAVMGLASVLTSVVIFRIRFFGQRDLHALGVVAAATALAYVEYRLVGNSYARTGLLVVNLLLLAGAYWVLKVPWFMMIVQYRRKAPA